jgi:hypothetical protein
MQLQLQPQKYFTEPVLQKPWLEMPIMCLFCDQDQALPLVVQEIIAKDLVNPVTYHAFGSHPAFPSVPDQLSKDWNLR